MMARRKIHLAEDFSRYPAGRVKTDGPYSGERFRVEFLEPVLKEDGCADIYLDGARGYGSSFLEEAFGGLVRQGYSVEQVLKAFTIHATDKSLKFEIRDYINHGGEE